MLLGPSGCGKTTTLRMVAGFIEPTAGTVALGGGDVTSLPPWKRNAGLVFQSYALFPHLTVAQNVAFGLEMRKLARGRHRAPRRRGPGAGPARAATAARLPRQLSGGQQQRVALARALAIRPDVLLLDEPLSNLDAKLRQEVRVEIRELQRKLGLTTVMVTHDQEEALTMADRLVVMNDGAVRQVGTQRDLYERPADRFVAGFVGRSTFLAGTVEAPGRFRTDGGLSLACTGGTAGAGVLALRPERLLDSPRARSGRTRQPPVRYGGIRLLSRRPDRHPCPPVAGRPAGRSDRQPRGQLPPRVGQAVEVGWPAAGGPCFRCVEFTPFGRKSCRNGIHDHPPQRSCGRHRSCRGEQPSPAAAAGQEAHRASAPGVATIRGSWPRTSRRRCWCPRAGTWSRTRPTIRRAAPR